MPFVKIHVHIVWATKNRINFFNTAEIRQQVWNHIRENSQKQGIFIDHINGYSDHCHCLISLGTEQTISKVVQLIKGESSFWINKQNICDMKFEWQKEYFAVSVSESALDNVRKYIRGQEEHHLKKSFQDEYEEFVQHYGFEKLG